MRKTTIEDLQAQLKDVRQQRDEFLQQRNSARQLACDLAEYVKDPIKAVIKGIPSKTALLAKIDLARGIGGYDFPVAKTYAEVMQGGVSKDAGMER
jgi:hypothetical protein